MVLRLSVVRLEISLTNECSQKNMRRILAYMTMVITPHLLLFAKYAGYCFIKSKFNAHKRAKVIVIRCTSIFGGKDFINAVKQLALFCYSG